MRYNRVMLNFFLTGSANSQDKGFMVMLAFGSISSRSCSTLGRRGFDTTTQRYFLGDVELHRRWLGVRGTLNYLASVRPSWELWGTDGKFFPDVSLENALQMLHPARFSPAGRWWFQVACTGPVALTIVQVGDLWMLDNAFSYGEMLGIQAAMFGRLFDPVPF